MKALYSICVMILLAASSVVSAQPYQCNKWRNSLGQCKSCGEAPMLSPLRVHDGTGCRSCGGFCTKLPPVAPPGEETVQSQDAAFIVADEQGLARLGLVAASDSQAECTPDFSRVAPDSFYAIRLDESVLSTIAAQSPEAANVLVGFRDRETMLPLKLDGGDLSSPVAPTAASVLRYFSDHNASDVLKAAAPLASDEYYESRYRVERLANGGRILVVESSIRHADGRLAAQIGEPFAIELVERVGEKRPVAQVNNGLAQVYDVGAFGPLSSF